MSRWSAALLVWLSLMIGFLAGVASAERVRVSNTLLEPAVADTVYPSIEVEGRRDA